MVLYSRLIPNYRTIFKYVFSLPWNRNKKRFLRIHFSTFITKQLDSNFLFIATNNIKGLLERAKESGSQFYPYGTWIKCLKVPKQQWPTLSPSSLPPTFHIPIFTLSCIYLHIYMYIISYNTIRTYIHFSKKESI